MLRELEPWTPPWPLNTRVRISYADQGVHVTPHLIPPALLDAYCTAYLAAGVAPLGWPDCTPYVGVAELRALCLCDELLTVVEHLLGEPALLHLNLTGWVSTERAWHQDTYLNPPEVGDRYLAVWIALEDIHADAGPFEYVPGSHRWPVITREAVFATLTPEQQRDPDWPRFTEGIVAPIFEEEAERRGLVPAPFLGRRGDVLFWHPRLVHRGSFPLAPGRTRKALIAHYSGDRSDMPAERRVRHGRGWYYVPPTSVPVR
jgi:ectoine hydroxylase-related dioxygenase (phytanoyl-CoA dioxygenase family)